ncbi:MAG: hypothetical protein KCHDKBKB_03092 [Elusimicrobia bacterium]|nr:hypothetical protein [Elusimicrobiota bacterium]
MKKILLYSAFLTAGLILSQIGPRVWPDLFAAIAPAIRVMTMLCLAFIMIHVGLEFDIDKSNLRQYGWDYVVAATAAAFPWIFCAVYFIFVLTPAELWGSIEAWKQSLLISRFAAPTSAGVLFSMLAAAGLATTWVFKKARILAIFDDLDTVLLMIPLKILLVGFKWQLSVVIVVIAVLVWLAWRYLHALKWSVSWPWILLYATALTLACELIYSGSKLLDDSVPVHLEVLLPAFVLGCMLPHPSSSLAKSSEERASGFITAIFMILVGLSMPAIGLSGSPASGIIGETRIGGAWPGWTPIIVHVLIITLLSNIGKMFSLFCYRRQATWKERLALSVAMFPRGEVGAGVLVVSLGYGIGGPAVTIAMLSLALNLLCTGLFISFVKMILSSKEGTAR